MLDTSAGMALEIVRDIVASRRVRHVAFVGDGNRRLEDASGDHRTPTVLAAIDYGGRDEIVRAANAAIREGPRVLFEADIASHLDTTGFPDPDVVIRTSGEQRTSGFMTWQAAYSEWFFCSHHFPEFSQEDLAGCLIEFGRRRRRFGS